ncbi:type II secretion system minor pseudopilin GspK [Alteromonas sp. LMIT006]|jgi:general secretion pathway protein K|uniref:type II secretion system minor pseudopilin GspK n=1 Tax=Alteromonadaceae TaxID=72275 RepID=UPI0020CA2D41|nr:type II secretion system minor pseudopilin GspK [Alteromonas sp. LMIT006]UTP73108.1 type II secretion system minor pseudopilin GspK [Alteromonas sp. LMIT006]
MIRHQRGAALLVVLFIVALVSIIAMQMGVSLQLQGQRTANIKAQNQAQWFALGAEQYATIAMKEVLSLSNGIIHLNQPWAEPITFPIENGMITAQLEDAQACFNINALISASASSSTTGSASASSTPTTSTAPAQQASTQSNGTSTTSVGDLAQAFTELVRRVNGNDTYNAEVVRDSLLDFIDEDSQARQLGAEDETYRGTAFPYLAANRFLADISELRLVNGVDIAWLPELLKYVCVIPNEHMMTVNINTLTEEDALLLSALLNITEADAQNLISNRPEDGYDDIQAFFNEPLLNTLQLDPMMQAWFTISTEYFTLRTETQYDQSRFFLSSLLRVSNDNELTVVHRKFGRF